MQFEEQLSKKELQEVIKKTPEYVEKYCKDCKWNYFCCQLRVKLSFWDRIRIRLAGHRIKKIADHHPKHGWMTKIEKGDCIFLKRSNGKAFCSIYKYRPRDCRIFPHFYEKDINCGEIIQEYKYSDLGGSEYVKIIMK